MPLGAAGLAVDAALVGVAGGARCAVRGAVFAALSPGSMASGRCCGSGRRCRCATWTPGWRGAGAGAGGGQPGRERHRRGDLGGGGRGGGPRRAGRAGDRGCLVRARPGRPGDRAAAGRAADDRGHRQRRWRHLLVPVAGGRRPAGRRAAGAVRAAVRDAAWDAHRGRWRRRWARRRGRWTTGRSGAALREALADRSPGVRLLRYPSDRRAQRGLAPARRAAVAAAGPARACA